MSFGCFQFLDAAEGGEGDGCKLAALLFVLIEVLARVLVLSVANPSVGFGGWRSALRVLLTKELLGGTKGLDAGLVGKFDSGSSTGSALCLLFKIVLKT
jgi:hypothetical protein